MTRDESNEMIVIDALRRFMINSDLSDQRISRLMGVEIETLRTWIAGTAIPRKQSLNKISSFLKWHGRKHAITRLPSLHRGFPNPLEVGRSAGLEVGDTAGLEGRATGGPGTSVEYPG